MTIGEKLKELRGERAQKDVAETVGITVSALSNYENDTRIPKDEIKKKLALYYKTNIEKLFFNE